VGDEVTPGSACFEGGQVQDGESVLVAAVSDATNYFGCSPLDVYDDPYICSSMGIPY